MYNEPFWTAAGYTGQTLNLAPGGSNCISELYDYSTKTDLSKVRGVVEGATSPAADGFLLLVFDDLSVCLLHYLCRERYTYVFYLPLYTYFNLQLALRGFS